MTLGVMTSNTPWSKSYTLRNRWGSNTPPRKNGITILIFHLGIEQENNVDDEFIEYVRTFLIYDL